MGYAAWLVPSDRLMIDGRPSSTDERPPRFAMLAILKRAINIEIAKNPSWLPARFSDERSKLNGTPASFAYSARPACNSGFGCRPITRGNARAGRPREAEAGITFR